ncbi:MAG: PDZ domain-containing protein [Parcubacteria group bacterium]|nr:PDZ domain-containing protein [Parcubacteria group bacterium]
MKPIVNFIKQHKTSLLISVCVSLLTILFCVLIAGGIFLFNKNLIVKVADFVINNSSIKFNASSQKPSYEILPEEARIVNIVEKTNPAVVSIIISKNVPIIEKYYQQFNPFGDDFWSQFFGNEFNFEIPQYRQKGTEKKEIGGGSGFLISADGLIITNKHVVNDKDAEYTVLTNDGKKYDAQIIAKDSFLDIAILKIKGNNFTYLDLGDSDELKLGQTVIAIGNALGEFRNSVSVGVISGLSRTITASDSQGKVESLEKVIQTDAAINPGNSGGPLLDLNGDVVGVNVAMETAAENIAFALPINMVKPIIESVKTYGEIIRPYLGIRYLAIDENVKTKNNLSVNYGVLVVRGNSPDELAVIPGSPADKAGIQENDIILEIDGIKLTTDKSLASIINQKKVGEIVKLKILHKGQEKTIEVKLEKAPSNL